MKTGSAPSQITFVRNRPRNDSLPLKRKLHLDAAAIIGGYGVPIRLIHNARLIRTGPQRPRIDVRRGLDRWARRAGACARARRRRRQSVRLALAKAYGIVFPCPSRAWRRPRRLRFGASSRRRAAGLRMRSFGGLRQSVLAIRDGDGAGKGSCSNWKSDQSKSHVRPWFRKPSSLARNRLIAFVLWSGRRPHRGPRPVKLRRFDRQTKNAPMGSGRSSRADPGDQAALS